MTAKLKKMIGQISLKGHIKILLVIFVMIGIFSGYTFADDPDAAINDLTNIIDKALSFFSRGWIVFANLAGKLMTNDIVYGGFLHLDTTLWTFWNVMKNIANFLLGFLVLYSVLQNLLSPVGVKPKTSPLDIIKNTLVAGILIQMSRFLVGAVLDVATVCTAAIGSFPAQFLAANNEFKSAFSNNLNLEKIIKNKVVVDYSNTEDPISIVPIEGDELSEEDMDAMLDTLLPSTDSLSGPLIYIGMSVFNFSDYNIQRVEDGGSRKELILSIGLNGAVLLAYSVMMLLIFIFNLMRVLVLWLAIPLMPLLIVASLFGFKPSDSSSILAQIINFKTLFKLAFKPVILAGALSLILIILVLVRSIITKKDNIIDLSEKNLVIHSVQQEDETYNSTMDIEGLVNVNMNGFKEGFADVIVYIIGLCLIYFVLKLSTVKTGIGFIDKAMDDIFNSVKNTFTNAPIIPIPGGRPVSISTLSQHLESDNVFTKALGLDIAGQNKLINEMLNISDTSYGTLDPTASRADFIKKAFDISMANNIATYDEIKKPNNSKLYQELNGKIRDWEKNHVGQQIPMEEIFDSGLTTKDNTSSTVATDNTGVQN